MLSHIHVHVDDAIMFVMFRLDQNILFQVSPSETHVSHMYVHKLCDSVHHCRVIHLRFPLPLSLSIQLRYFRFPKGVNAVRVVLSSKSSNNCAIVSVQNASVSLFA